MKTLKLSLVLVLAFLSCKKEEVPTVTTEAVTTITGTTAVSGGSITSEGSGTVLSRGVCWSTEPTPTIADSRTTDGAGAGSYNSNITGLTGATIYYARAYATNETGTGYGMAMSFKTLGQKADVETLAAVNKNASETKLYGLVNGNYLPTNVVFEYGLTIPYGQSSSANENPITGNSVVTVTSDLQNLQPGTTYHYRVKATNSVGISYGTDKTFTTFGKSPSVYTVQASNITLNSAKVNSGVNPNYLPSTVQFEYGLTTSYGQTISADQNPLTGGDYSSASVTIAGLTPATAYHYRVKATNSLGTSYGSDMTFTTTFITGIEYGGGIICYVDASGQHGLIAAKNDQSTGIQWYKGTNIPINNTGSAIGTGLTNTTKIINAQGLGTYAARLCYDLVINQYDDWYMPSKDELKTMYNNLKSIGLGNFADAHYWSSTESLTNANAWYIYFGDGAEATAGKEYQYYVRAVRSF